jgi:hypothetical protein
MSHRNVDMSATAVAFTVLHEQTLQMVVVLFTRSLHPTYGQ